MPDFKIIGNPNPVVGVTETYSIDFLSLPIIPTFQGTSYQKNVFENQVKWTVHVLERGRWRPTKENEKHGNPITYTFFQRSLTRDGLRIKAEINGLSARLDIKPQNAECPRILAIDLLNSQGNKPIKQFTYGEWFIARIHAIHMERRRIFATLWEDDSKGSGHNKANTFIKSETGIVKEGIADIKFFLDPGNVWLPNAKLAPGGQNEGKNHEYYVTAEFFFNGSPHNLTSSNTNVPNPDYKPKSLKQTPAEQKGLSKKDAKGINKAENKVFDYHETKVSVKPVIEFNPVMELYNKVMKVNVDDKWWEKKEENCGEKYCIKKGDKNELIREINIRLAGFGGNVPTDEFTDRTEKMIKQFQRDYMQVPETGKVCGNVLKAIDEFSLNFDLSGTVWSDLDCSCTTKGSNVTSSLRIISEINNCKGWGDGTGKGTYKIGNAEKDHKYEYPGIHRSLLFGFKAVLFYLSKHPTYRFRKMSSGYRCRFKNYMTTNHQGKAIDIQFKDTGDIGGTLQSNIPKLKKIREDIFYKYLNAKTNWVNGTNNFCLEPIALIYKPNGKIDQNYTYSWIHFDVREFESIYLEDKYFCKNKDGLNGTSIIQIAKKYGFEKTCSCFSNEETKNNKSSQTPSKGSCIDKFDKVAPIILEHEGGYKNEPSKDKGDPTNKGISWPVWVKYAKADLSIEPTVENQKNLTSEQATIIYRKRYWEPKGYCEIEDLKIALMVYDWSITSGGAIKEIQKLLVNEYSQTITIGGGMGKNTATAINEASKQGDLLNKIAEIRRAYYKKGADKGWFSDDYSKGLDNRVTKCLNYEL